MSDAHDAGGLIAAALLPQSMPRAVADISSSASHRRYCGNPIAPAH
jgi:hypothetical protein